MSAPSSPSAAPAVDLAVERVELARARAAVQTKLATLAGISGGGADELADEYIDAVVRGAVEKLQQELVVFGRIDDDRPWRVGLYGIDLDGDQLVIDWRSRFARGFYQARLDDPMGLERRVTYVGCITDLFVEDFVRGEVTGSSPLMAELSRSRGSEMRAAVATLQSDQDTLVRLAPTDRLVLRGGPGTGKTVVGLHRAAWLVYNDTRLTAGRILVIGPSDRFLRFVSAVLPTLGEARIVQTTFDRLLGPSTDPGSDERWLALLDRFEEGLYAPDEIKVGPRRIRETEVAELIDSLRARPLPWRERRKVFLSVLANRHGLDRLGDLSRAAASVWPSMTTAQAWKKLRSRATLEALGADPRWIDAWRAVDGDGPLRDEVRARFEGVPSTYGHVIVDEAQDMTLLQLRAVQRRSAGVSLVGDDAQRSTVHGIGLRRAARTLDVEPAVMATAYRMSAEIAAWLNAHAEAHGIDAVRLIGIRPNGIPVTTAEDPEAAWWDLADQWSTTALITAEDAWSHKGVEYDGVVVDARAMDPAQIYLAASRAAHQLVIAGSPP